jgi:nickel/cobalt transporter (NiCoT) family protein
VSRWARIRAALTPPEWRRAAVLAAVILGLHAAGFFILLALVVPNEYSLAGGGVFGLGVGITAYALGLRHAFDADHIAAIDNTTRKLMAEGQRPLSVGFFFSLGHSTVVLVLAVLLAAGVRALGGAVADESSALQETTGLIGTLVSGSFLYVIGILNLGLLVGVLRVFARARRGELTEAQLEAQLTPRGPLNRFYGRLTRAVRKPWHMYPLGILFGLGFDTATEIALLVLAAGASFGGLPFYAILCLPVLFAAGMSLLDTIDGAVMGFAYDWALARPVRKLYYNLTITGLSVAVALGIGTIELLSVLTERLGLSGGVWDWVGGVDLGAIGYVVAALFALTWAVAVAVWRLGRIEQRWAVRPGR